MSTVIIEDTFRPELYANSIHETSIHPETKSGIPSWGKWLIGLLAVGLILAMALPYLEEWLGSQQPSNPEDKKNVK